MYQRPDKVIVEYELTAPGVEPILLREEKFISANDVVSTVITASRPVTLEVTGHSYPGGGGAGTILYLNGTCTADMNNNVRYPKSNRSHTPDSTCRLPSSLSHWLSRMTGDPS